MTVFLALQMLFLCYPSTHALQLRTGRLSFRRLSRRGHDRNAYSASTLTPKPSTVDNISQRKYRNEDDILDPQEQESSYQKLAKLKKLVSPTSTIRSKLPSTSLLKRKERLQVTTVEELRAGADLVR